MTKLSEFNDKMLDCKQCNLAYLDVNMKNGKLKGTGNPDSKVVFVAIAPSYWRKGDVVFNTPANPNDKVFLDMLELININRSAVYVTNLIKCSLLENREPSPDEIVNCNKLLMQELLIIKPKLVVCVGRVVADHFGVDIGKIKKYNNLMQYFYVTAIHHPSFILRGGMTREQYLVEFKRLKDMIGDFCVQD